MHNLLYTHIILPLPDALTHFHASPVLTVNGLVSVICRVQVLCSEVISNESQVLGKNHTPSGLHQTQTTAETSTSGNRRDNAKTDVIFSYNTETMSSNTQHQND